MPRRAKNEGTIYKKTTVRNGKEYTYWEAQVSTGHDPITGKRTRKTFTGDTQKEVRAKMQAASLAVENKYYFEPSTAKLSEWIDMWLSEYCENIKYQSKRTYRSVCNKHIKPNIGNIPLSELSTHHIQLFYNNLSRTEPKHAPGTIHHIAHVLSKCLNTAVEIKFIKENPASRAKLPKLEKKEIKPLTNDQIKQFLSEIEKSPYANFYKTILFTGLRRSEASGLTWDCIDFSSNTIIINKQLIRKDTNDGGYTLTTTKNGKPRTLYISKYVAELLTEQKRIQDTYRNKAGDAWHETGLVFTTELGTPVPHSTIRDHFKKAVTAIGLPECRTHDLRHTFAVLSLQNGDDVRTVQDNLGHASASFTLEIYAHSTADMKGNAADRMQHFIETLNGKSS